MVFYICHQWLEAQREAQQREERAAAEREKDRAIERERIAAAERERQAFAAERQAMFEMISEEFFSTFSYFFLHRVWAYQWVGAIWHNLANLSFYILGESAKHRVQTWESRKSRKLGVTKQALL